VDLAMSRKPTDAERAAFNAEYEAYLQASEELAADIGAARDLFDQVKSEIVENAQPIVVVGEVHREP
jgi:hypothetical protein